MGPIQLLPNQVSKGWAWIGGAIAASLPPTCGDSETHMANVLQSIMAGRLTVWLLSNELETIPGIAVTRTYTDDIDGTRTLLIYAMYAFTPLTDSQWLDCFQGLIKYAKTKSAEKIIFYTTVPEILKRASSFGGGPTAVVGEIPVR